MKYLFLLVGILLAGCLYTMRPYIEPSGEENSEIIFHNSGIKEGSAEIFDRYEKCGGRKITSFFKKGEKLALKISGGAPLSFSLGYSISSNPYGFTYCRVYATFEPKIGESYDANITGDKEGCSLTLTVRNKGNPIKVKYVLRQPILALNEDSDFCK